MLQHQQHLKLVFRLQDSSRIQHLPWPLMRNLNLLSLLSTHHDTSCNVHLCMVFAKKL
uniref:26S proteasome non-ATPase regulatory subunit 1 homolog A-like n=1 Tax=Rhizophora mucronata TaxID=61149 RepID=A0A2P2J179_RHIMU